MRASQTAWLASVTVALFAAAGCGPLVNALRDSEARTITLAPQRIDWRWSVDRLPRGFGVCPGFDRSGAYPYGATLMTDFASPWVSGIAGHEVHIRRGESCHQRSIYQLQTAVRFDLASLPAGAISRARLLGRSFVNLGRDSPFVLGTSDQCDILRLGRATEDWRPEDSFPLVPWEGTGRWAGEFGGSGSPGRLPLFDVTTTARAWAAGDLANFGFVIAPDPPEAKRQGDAISETADQFVCPLMMGEFQLEVLMLVRR